MGAPRCLWGRLCRNRGAHALRGRAGGGCRHPQRCARKAGWAKRRDREPERAVSGSTYSGSTYSGIFAPAATRVALTPGTYPRGGSLNRVRHLLARRREATGLRHLRWHGICRFLALRRSPLGHPKIVLRPRQRGLGPAPKGIDQDASLRCGWFSRSRRDAVQWQVRPARCGKSTDSRVLRTAHHQ